MEKPPTTTRRRRSDFNYVIKQFNARVMTFFRDTRFNAVRSNFWQAGVGLQLQM